MLKSPNIIGDTWFNTKPLNPEDLQGKIILIDFWTYSCVNCLRTIPYIKQWWQKYKDKNFIIIGVHTPEFDFEKNPKNVENAIKELGIEWPVVLDNDFINWENFANHYWPAKYLIDEKGTIIYQHFGEGKYTETEFLIQSLIKNISNGSELPLPISEEDEHIHGNVCFIPTPESYCGFLRGRLSNTEGYNFNKIAYYTKQEVLPDHIGLSGNFLASAEYVESQDQNSKLYLHFKATEVNLVLCPVSGQAKIKIMFNNETINTKILGKNVNENGEVMLDSCKMYNLLNSMKLMSGILEISPIEGNFQAYAFTFSGCENRPIDK